LVKKKPPKKSVPSPEGPKESTAALNTAATTLSEPAAVSTEVAPAPQPAEAMSQASDQTAPKVESGPRKAERQPPALKPLEENLDISSTYAEDSLILLVRDPWWIFAYWELTPQKMQETLFRMLPGSNLRPVLRLHDVTARDFDHQGSNHFEDFDCHVESQSYYLKVGQPDRDYLVELGLLDQDGRFFRLLRSNAVRTPREQPSPEWGSEWASFVDESFEELFRLSGGGRSQRGGSSGRMSVINMETSEGLVRKRDK
jgi:hypothetical protein